MLAALFGSTKFSKLKHIERNILDWHELHDGIASKFIVPPLGWGMKQRRSKGYLELLDLAPVLQTREGGVKT